MTSYHSTITVDLTVYPDLVVAYYGMKAKNLRGVATVLHFRKRIRAVLLEKTDGLLLNEFLTYSLSPFHLGMRQYWQDFSALECWARSNTEHLEWWKGYLKDSQHTSFWHEAYCLSGGCEAVYNYLDKGIGLAAFAPQIEVQGKLRMARNRLARTKTGAQTGE